MTKPDSRVIEFGCGNGELLLKLSSKIDSGLGIDQSKSQIEKALIKKKENKISNVEFVCQSLDKNFSTVKVYDTAIASLFFHVIPVKDSICLINKMKEIADTILICGFCKPKTLPQRSLLWIDQKLTNHYKHFKAYTRFGFLNGILSECKISNIKTYDTKIPFVKIYEIN